MKTVLVTGARSGIISKVVDKLLLNYYIYLTVHTESELKAVKKKYQNIKNVSCFKLDVTNPHDREKAQNLKVDIFISNAAIGESGSVLEMNIDRIRKNFEVNVFSNFELTQIILQNMVKRGKGKLIIMASLAGEFPIPFLGSYCATKASVIKLSECLNMEMKIKGARVDVSIIEPGFYATGFNELIMDNKYDEDDFIEFFNRQIKLIRTSENLALKLLEKKRLGSIVNKIVKCVCDENPRLYYRAPFLQKTFVKFYLLFK